jgi:hypothetical protein
MEANFYGSLQYFRALMLRLQDRHGGDEWTLPSGARLVVRERSYSDPTINVLFLII